MPQQTVRDIMADYKKVPIDDRDSSLNRIYMLRFLQNIASTLERIEEQLWKLARRK